MNGELVGINTAIFSRSGGSIGIGFAIPANMVRTVVQSAESGGSIQRPWIGAETAGCDGGDRRFARFARPEGALIVRACIRTVRWPSRASSAAMSILGIDGKPVENAKELSYRVATAQVGSSAIFEYQRGTEAARDARRAHRAPETTARDETLMKGNTPFTGLSSPICRRPSPMSLGLPSASTGVVAADIKGGPARRLFRKGDVILEVNGVVIDSVDTLNSGNQQGATATGSSRSIAADA